MITDLDVTRPRVAGVLGRVRPSGHRSVWRIARELRSVLPEGFDPEDLRSEVARWNESTPIPFERVWKDFLDGWERVSPRFGEALEQVREDLQADHFSLGKGDGLDRVCRAFRALDFYQRGDSFYTGYRQIADLAGLTHVYAGKLAEDLIGLGLLEEVEKGTRGYGGKATVWKWVGPPLDRHEGGGMLEIAKEMEAESLG